MDHGCMARTGGVSQASEHERKWVRSARTHTHTHSLYYKRWLARAQMGAKHTRRYVCRYVCLYVFVALMRRVLQHTIPAGAAPWATWGPGTRKTGRYRRPRIGISRTPVWFTYPGPGGSCSEDRYLSRASASWQNPGGNVPGASSTGTFPLICSSRGQSMGASSTLDSPECGPKNKFLT